MVVGNEYNNMSKDFISEQEMQGLEKQGLATMPDFIPDSEADNYFGIQNKKPEVTKKFLEGHGVLKGISDFIGTTGLGKGLAQGIFLKFTPEGKDILKRIENGEMQYSDLENIIGKGVTNKEIIGSGIQTAASFTGLGKALPSIAGRIGVGTAVGTGIGAGGALQQNQDTTGVLKSAAIGGAVGFGVSGVFEGVGAILRKTVGNKFFKNTYNKELQPPKKELAQSIEKGFKTFGEDVRGLKNPNGTPVYQGTYNTMMNQAKTELQTKGTQLSDLLKNIDSTQGVVLKREQVFKGIKKVMEDNYGKLSDAQIKQIRFEISRMPKTFNLTGLEKIKRMYDNLIPDSFWTKIDDPAISFPSLVKYTLRDNARKLINETVADPIVQRINNELGIAMDVKKLAASQIAQRALTKISAQGGLFGKLYGRIIDDFIFNPAITTRISQGAKGAGKELGDRGAKQQLLRQTTRLGITKGITESE